MKKILKSITAWFLAAAARAVIRRYRPRVVMITGSVGKTSTKDAVATVLAERFYLRKSEKSFNSEFGVPFTILGVKNPWGNPLSWLSVVRAAFALLVLPNHYPNLLVLEVGADVPGDLAKTLKIATPDAVVVTRLPEIPVHVEAYESPEAVREEEFSPAYALPPEAPLIFSADDPFSRAMVMRTPSRLISYGEERSASVRLTDGGYFVEDGVTTGMTAHVSMGEENGQLVIRGSVGRTQLLPAAAAIAVGLAFDVPLENAIAALEKHVPPPGRCRLLTGKGGALIIDDTYNSSPAAAEEALRTLHQIPNATRRIAALGDMLELGRYSVGEHERIGALAAESADMLVAVGIRARAFARAAHSAGMSEASIMLYDDSRAAAAALAPMLGAGDVVLVKGSQSMRMERVVANIISSDSDRAKLVRQDKEWLRRV